MIALRFGLVRRCIAKQELLPAEGFFLGMAALAGDAVSEEAAQAARNNAATQQGVEHLAAVRAPDPAPTPDAPFSLLFKPGLPA